MLAKCLSEVRPLRSRRAAHAYRANNFAIFDDHGAAVGSRQFRGQTHNIRVTGFNRVEKYGCGHPKAR